MKTHRLRWLFIFALAAGGSLAGCAAQAKGLSEANSTRSTMRRVITCMVKKDFYESDGRWVTRYLTTESDQDAAQVVMTFRAQNCVFEEDYDGRHIGFLGMPRPLARGQMFRAIVLGLDRGRYRRGVGAKLQSILQLDAKSQFWPMRTFGACVARLDPDNSRRAIASKIAGPEEQAAYQALAPSLSRCVAPGDTVTFTKSVLEGALAEGLFVNSQQGQP